MAFLSYIGATVQVVAGAPATEDAAGYTALSFSTALGYVVELGELGDTSNDISVDTLAGRTYHVNGSKDGGEVAFTFAVDGAVSDAGQAILIAKSNTNDEVSFKVTDPDGEVLYFHGKIANVKDQARNNSAYKGMTGAVRVNGPVVRVAAGS